MNILKTTATALFAGTVLISACLPGRVMAAEQEPATVSQATTASGWLSALALPLQPKIVGAAQSDVPTPRVNCRAGHLYSQHDVVGDPDSCIKGMANFGTGGGIATG